MRPSPVRTMIMSRATTGALLTSLDSTTSQRLAPVAASSAISSPLPPPTSTRPAPAPTPADSGLPVSTRQTSLPLCTFRRATLPDSPATKTPSPSATGVNTNRPASGTDADQALDNWALSLNSVSEAGGKALALPEPNQPDTVSVVLPSMPQPPIRLAASINAGKDAKRKLMTWGLPGYPASSPPRREADWFP